MEEEASKLDMLANALGVDELPEVQEGVDKALMFDIRDDKLFGPVLASSAKLLEPFRKALQVSIRK